MTFDAVTDRFSAALILLGAALRRILWVWGPDGLPGWPLVFSLLPWAFYWLRQGRVAFPRTDLNLPLILFLVTGGVAVWAAYDPELAWEKFWILLSAAILYVALASQPKQNLWAIAAMFAMFGVGVAGFFLLTHDWNAVPVGIGFIDALGRRWMELRGWSGSAESFQTERRV